MNNNIAYVGENTHLTIYKISRRIKNKNELIEKYYNLIQQANKNKNEIYPQNLKDTITKAIKMK